MPNTYSLIILWLIQAANRGTQQIFFTSELNEAGIPTGGWSSTGLMNYFGPDGNRTNCTDASIVFSRTKADNPARKEGYSGTFERFWSCALYPNLTHNFRESRLPKRTEPIFWIRRSIRVYILLKTSLHFWPHVSLPGARVPEGVNRRRAPTMNSP